MAIFSKLKVYRALQEKMFLLWRSENSQAKDGETDILVDMSMQPDEELRICSSHNNYRIS
ncbi:MAG: hypothetical protein ACYSSI_11270 [Planctomycetota bacterium]|jgi:hypothetical protein